MIDHRSSGTGNFKEPMDNVKPEEEYEVWTFSIGLSLGIVANIRNLLDPDRNRLKA